MWHRLWQEDFSRQQSAIRSYRQPSLRQKKLNSLNSLGHTVHFKVSCKYQSSTSRQGLSLEMLPHSIKTPITCHWEEISSRTSSTTGAIKIVTSSRRPRTLAWYKVQESNPRLRRVEVPLVKVISVRPKERAAVFHTDRSQGVLVSQSTISWDYLQWRHYFRPSSSKSD